MIAHLKLSVNKRSEIMEMKLDALMDIIPWVQQSMYDLVIAESKE